MQASEADVLLASALKALPAEDAAIIRLRYIQGLTNRQIARALHVAHLGEDRVKRILATLRSLLTVKAAQSTDAPRPTVAVQKGSSP